MSKHPQPAPTASAVSPCPTMIQISRTPRHWKFTQHHRTTRPPPSWRQRSRRRGHATNKFFLRFYCRFFPPFLSLYLSSHFPLIFVLALLIHWDKQGFWKKTRSKSIFRTQFCKFFFGIWKLLVSSQYVFQDWYYGHTRSRYWHIQRNQH